MSRGRRRSVQEWAQIVEDQASSGDNVAKFCRARSIGVANFYHWRRRLQDEKPTFKANDRSFGSFVEVGKLDSSAMATKPVVSLWTVTLDFGEGLKLTLQRG